jgi:hypothetical protein
LLPKYLIVIRNKIKHQEGAGELRKHEQNRVDHGGHMGYQEGAGEPRKYAQHGGDPF